MKESRLGEFEEVLVLLVGILGDNAYAFRIAEEFKKQTGRAVSVGSVHSTLNRLETKGLLKSEMGPATQRRGGRSKRIFRITASGEVAINTSKALRISLWNQYPGLANG